MKFLTEEKSDYINDNKHKFNLDEDIIKFSILRNNLNNQIIKQISFIIGEGNKSLNEVKSLKQLKNTSEMSSMSNDNKKTIINVNQYYPSYFINANEIIKNTKNNIDKKYNYKYIKLFLYLGISICKFTNLF